MKNTESMSGTRSYTLTEVAGQYNVSPKTMRLWIRPIRDELLGMYPFGQKRIRILLPRQVKRIEEFLG